MAKPYTDDAPAVDVRDAGLDKKFVGLVSARQGYKSIIADAETKVKKLNEDIIKLQAESGYKTVLTPDFRVTLTSGVHTSISKEKLLEQGVSAKVIAKATTRTEYETLTVTARKD